MGVDPTALANPSVDIISEHYYDTWAKAISDVRSTHDIIRASPSNDLRWPADHGAWKHDSGC